jgi:signal transduction histidine kinase
MLKYDANVFRLIRSKIGLKIGILIVIQIIFIMTSFSILSYYESQITYLGNSINIAGKNRFLTSNLIFHISEYFLEGNSRASEISHISKINFAIDQLESNILALRQGGKISDIELKPLPSEFVDDWNIINQKWISIKAILTNNIIKSNEKLNPVATTEIDKVIKTTLLSLVDSSNALVTKLGEYARNSSQNSMFLQRIFAVLNIAVAAVVLFFVMKILKPIFALTTATSEVSRGNLDVSVKSRGNDELSVLSESFNSMVNSIKNYVKKQNELTNKLENVNEELKHKDRLKDEFINVAAHELRSPIQPILALSEFLLCRKRGGDNSSNSAIMNIDKEEELLDVIVRNAKRLRQLTEDILDISRIESRSLLLNKENFDINKKILNVIKDVEKQISDPNKLKILFTEPREAIFVDADKVRIYQVIANLLNNAIKFTKEGTISVSVKVTQQQRDENKEKKARDYGGSDGADRSTRQVIVSVKDSGVGIDPEILPKLFTKFATKSQIGTGLGLFISKSIIEAHGGKIWAENNSDGKGATFSFSLPIN